MNICSNQQALPGQVLSWVSAARQLDQAKGDRDPQTDSLDWQGLQPLAEGSKQDLVWVHGNFDDKGPRTLKMELSSTEYFWRSQIKVASQRHGDQQDFTVRHRHPNDPQMFDYRATFSQNLSTGKIENYHYRQGPPAGLEAVREIVTDPASATLLGCSGLLLGGMGYAMAGLPGLAIGAASGILFGGAFVASNGLV